MVGVGRVGMARIEIRQRHHRQDFAGIDVHDQSGAAFGGEIVDDALQFLMDDVLQANVDRQLQRLFPSAEALSRPRSMPA